MKFRIILLTAFAALFFAQVSYAQGCEENPEFEVLNFWVGEWEVFVDETQVGTNRIEQILDGCAIMEHWQDVRGGQGKSLFYYHPTEGRWKQIWVTPNPFRPGGVKEKAHIETLDNGAIRFQGTVVTLQGQTYLDRTTLIPTENGDVRQIIEISADEGESWREMFNAVYKKKG